MFDPKRFVEEKVSEAKEKIKGKAIIAVSGGVDSTVAASIVSNAIGEDLLAVHVDNGFMRDIFDGKRKRRESEYIVEVLKDSGINAKLVDASEEFLDALKEVSEPEEKRRIIGEKFIRIFENEAREFGAEYLVQGTIAPDWIESGGGQRDTIKTHHNVGGLPEKISLKLFEPNRNLYKDETRKVAEFLGFPDKIYRRQPFPGPGLAIRVVGAPPMRKNIEIVRRANYLWEKIIEDAIRDGTLEYKERQYFAGYFPNTKIVGVHGDLRFYKGFIGLRCIETKDYMTANFEKLPWGLLEEASIEITNELGKDVVGVFYDIANKPPRTVEFE
ncbi:MAG: glutamine-hydrolyzing GMP synthase subunit GuaA [Candidatus Aenigmarchaeota archaeon]|nr:glutamine-hydrolyzing GMP synthase subunit GuaA [Candidatus Aenigmarchaeota archaeon]